MTADTLDLSALARWRRDPITFIETCLRDPESGEPFVLSDAERQFLQLAFTLDADGRLKYPELVFGAIKKSGKTTLAAIIMLVMILLYGGKYAEGFCVANDLEQAQSRVFAIAKRIIEASPLLKREARITADKIAFEAIGATIIALASDAASAAGANPVITCFDELWGYTSERSRRLWDEMVPPPTRKIACRLTVSYAGFSGESILLEELHRRGMSLPEVGPSLHAGDGMLFAWHTAPIAPWQDDRWLAEMRRSLRPSAFLRMIQNEFVTTESSFIDQPWWDACVHPDATPLLADRNLPVWVGVDASVKRDSTALAAVTVDRKAQTTRLVWHRIFQPSPDDPLDFESTVEASLRDLHKRFRLKRVYYDPYQMHGSALRLTRAGIKMEEFPQSVPNLTEASQNLYEQIKGHTLVAYPDAAIRLAISRAVAVETPRGWRISKDKQAHKIDVVIALAMAALAALRGQSESSYDSTYRWVSDAETPEQREREWQRLRYAKMLAERSQLYPRW